VALTGGGGASFLPRILHYIQPIRNALTPSVAETLNVFFLNANVFKLAGSKRLTNLRQFAQDPAIFSTLDSLSWLNEFFIPINIFIKNNRSTKVSPLPTFFPSKSLFGEKSTPRTYLKASILSYVLID
jgi:hypothetical protein